MMKQLLSAKHPEAMNIKMIEDRVRKTTCQSTCYVFLLLIILCYKTLKKGINHRLRVFGESKGKDGSFKQTYCPVWCNKNLLNS